MMNGITVLSSSEIMDTPTWTCVITMIGFLIFAICISFVENPTGKYTYKVTISDEVNFVEFDNKYEIIDQDGLIYTISEKEKNNESN